MSDINFDPTNKRYSSDMYNPSIDSELRSIPWKALNGSKTMEEEDCDPYNFSNTVFNGDATDIASCNDIQTPQGQNGFAYFDAFADDDLQTQFPIEFSKMEDSLRNLIPQAQAEVYPDAKLQEDQGALKSLEIESDNNMMNHFFGNDNILKQNQIYQPYNDVHHTVERSQCHSSIMKTFTEPDLKPLSSTYYGNRLEEDIIVNLQQFTFPDDVKNSFDLLDLDDDSGTSLRKKLCHDPRILREGQGHVPLKIQMQVINQTLPQKSDKDKLPSKKVIKTNDNKAQKKVKASDMLQKQQSESFCSGGLVNIFTQDDFYPLNFIAEYSNDLNTTPVFIDETSFVTNKGHQLEQPPFTVPRIPDEQLSNFCEDTGIRTSVTNDHLQRNEGTPISESQSNSNPSRPSPLESVDSLEEKKTSSKRPERNYLRVFVSGILKMIERGKIGLFLDQLERSGIVTKKDVLSDLINTKEFTTSYRRFKNAVFANYTPELIESVQFQDMLKKAKLRLVYEFIMKENYEFWVHNEFAPFNFKCNQMRHEENEKEKQLKRENFLKKRAKLCKKFLSCFQYVPQNLTL